MPPRKRKASVKAAEPSSKKVRIEDDSTIVKPDDTLPSRPKRKPIGTPQYNFTRPRTSSKKQADNGSQAKTAVTQASDPDRPTKRRGRPPKEPALVPPKVEATETARAAVKARSTTKDAAGDGSKKKTKPQVAEEAPTAKRRGRPPKADAAKRTRSDPPKKPTASKKTLSAKAEEPTSQAAHSAVEGIPTPRKRGRPPKNVQTNISASLMDPMSDEISDADNILDEDADEEHGEHQYWLMKAEPQDRFEKGINVKFSIDDLAAAEGPEPWDGIRNYVARNNMRAMRKGDLAFFYHSNCPTPGIVGVMRIVQEHTTDQSAFDPNHPYYDPKSSPSKPKWDCVHVEFVKKFDTQITLKMMQENKNKSGELADMSLLRLGRLSVSNVTPKEWRYILKMANEDVNIGKDEPIAVQKDGYEADTDGEVDDGPKEELNGDIAAGNVDVEMQTDEIALTNGDAPNAVDELAMA